MKSASKIFGIGDAEYTSAGQGKTSIATRKKVNAKKSKLIRSWKKNLVGVLNVGTGLDIHLDTAMRELVEELQKLEDTIKGGNNE